jgi:hypothetical protein
MTILDYSISDLLFAYWLKRKREFLSQHQTVPSYIEERLKEARKRRNPKCSIFIFDIRWEVGWNYDNQ